MFPDTIYMTNINDIIDFMVEHENDEKNIYYFLMKYLQYLKKRKNCYNKKILSFISQLRKRKIYLLPLLKNGAK